MRRGVKPPARLGEIAAHHGRAGTVGYLFDNGIGGSLQAAFQAACIRGRLEVLDAIWARGYFGQAAYAVAFVKGDWDLYRWAAAKAALDLEGHPRLLRECLSAVAKRDDLPMYQALYSYYPLNALLPEVLELAEPDGELTSYIYGKLLKTA